MESWKGWACGAAIGNEPAGQEHAHAQVPCVTAGWAAALATAEPAPALPAMTVMALAADAMADEPPIAKDRPTDEEAPAAATEDPPPAMTVTALAALAAVAAPVVELEFPPAITVTALAAPLDAEDPTAAALALSAFPPAITVTAPPTADVVVAAMIPSWERPALPAAAALVAAAAAAAEVVSTELELVEPASSKDSDVEF